MLETMARIAPSQPNEAMARIAFRRNGTISLDPNLSAFNKDKVNTGLHGPFNYPVF
jgi:hypothetical protein